MCVRVYTDGCIEKGRASATEIWRKQSHLGTPDLMLGARKKRRDRGRGGALHMVEL